MNDKNHDNRARLGALAASAVLTMAAAIGLTTASEYQAPRADAQTQRGAAAAHGGPASLPPSVPNDDPELMRIDRANDHHG
jgi:hypothetical protein